ncbi:MAG: tail fiber domain-containing protein, partial [Muribaculaceae bacterium]|nr:tail fiber domain-containing protein [Muribaculaceae bacterium]
MKKNFLTLALTTAVALATNAQLRVLDDGHVQVGHLLDNTTGYNKPLSSNFSILGNGSAQSNGKISFGSNEYVSIGESSIDPNSTTQYLRKGALILNGIGGIKYTSDFGDVFSYYPNRFMLINPGGGGVTSTYSSFTFHVNVTAPQYLTSSDARYKSNIQSIEGDGVKLYLLNPVSYNLNIPSKNENEAETKNENEAEKLSKNSQVSNSSENNLTFGFIAQEVREIYPNLVFEDEEGMLSIDYTGFIPLLVEEMKSLRNKVTEQEEMIYSLTSGAKKTRGIAGVEELYGEDKIVLLQNRPNPFKSSTEIRCHLPQEVSEAFICIYDLNGRQQMRLDIRDRGDVAVTVSGNALQPGMYI